MDNQHRKITGYRELDENEVHLINELKGLGERVGATLDAMAEHPGTEKRCVAIAKTKAQETFMWAIRAVAKPGSFA